MSVFSERLKFLGHSNRARMGILGLIERIGIHELTKCIRFREKLHSMVQVSKDLKSKLVETP